MYTIYGIPNCDTIKKALNWMKEQSIAFEFHNYKTMGITEKHLKNWCEQIGWETIFNKRSTTFKELTPTVQSSVNSAETAIPVMLEHNSIIKRPVITKDNKVILVGFDAKKYAEVLGRK